MAYATTNPPQLVSSAIAGFGQKWRYESADAAAVADTDGYFTNAKDLGIKAGDVIEVVDTDTFLTTTHAVATINADGSADLADGVAETSVTDTD